MLDTFNKELQYLQSKVLYLKEQMDENVDSIEKLFAQSKEDIDELPFDKKYELSHRLIERVLISKPNRQLRYTVAEIYTKVDDKVYVYGIKTKSCKWKLIEVRNRGDEE